VILRGRRGGSRAAGREPEQVITRAETRADGQGVERAIAWLTAHGNRRVPFRGTHGNDLWLHHRAAGLNLRRLLALGLHHTGGTWAIA
jgi:hypothetical protein